MFVGLLSPLPTLCARHLNCAISCSEFRLPCCHKPIGEAPAVAADGSTNRRARSSSESDECDDAWLSIVQSAVCLRQVCGGRNSSGNTIETSPAGRQNRSTPSRAKPITADRRERQSG